MSRELKLPWSLEIDSVPVGAGPMLEHIAGTYDPTSSVPLPSFPTPTPGVLSFSYGGLLSAVQRFVEKTGPPATSDGQTRAAIALAFQQAAVSQLEKKIRLALRLCADRGVRVSTLVASGGVASNKFLRARCGSTSVTFNYSTNQRSDIRLESFLIEQGIRVEYPPISLCTGALVVILKTSNY